MSNNRRQVSSETVSSSEEGPTDFEFGIEVGEIVQKIRQFADKTGQPFFPTAFRLEEMVRAYLDRELLRHIH